MHTYRVTIDTAYECYAYEVAAGSPAMAEKKAKVCAENDGWDGMGLPQFRVEQLD